MQCGTRASRGYTATSTEPLRLCNGVMYFCKIPLQTTLQLILHGWKTGKPEAAKPAISQVGAKIFVALRKTECTFGQAPHKPCFYHVRWKPSIKQTLSPTAKVLEGSPFGLSKWSKLQKLYIYMYIELHISGICLYEYIYTLTCMCNIQICIHTQTYIYVHMHVYIHIHYITLHYITFLYIKIHYFT